MHTVLIGCNYRYPSLEIARCHIVDTVRGAAVAAHIMYNTPAGDNDAVAALLDALEVAVSAMGPGGRLTLYIDLGHLPHAAEVWRTGNKRVCTADQDQPGEVRSVSARWRMCDGDTVNVRWPNRAG